MTGYGPRNTGLSHPKFRVPVREAVSKFYRTEKVIHQGKFKMHWWVHQRGRSSKISPTFIIGPKHYMGFWVGGSY